MIAISLFYPHNFLDQSNRIEKTAKEAHTSNNFRLHQLYQILDRLGVQTFQELNRIDRV